MSRTSWRKSKLYSASLSPNAWNSSGFVGGLLVFYQSQVGKRLWKFIQASRTEIRKVVWPTRQEAMQTTIAVIIFTLIFGLFFWGLDMVLGLLVRMVQGT